MIGMVEEARVAGIDVRVVPDMYDGLAWNARVEYIGQFPTIPLHRREFPIGGIPGEARAGYYCCRRWRCAGFAPVMLAIALAMRMDSEGRSSIKAQRIGRKGRAFPAIKFRTMVRNADKLKAELEHMNERDGVLFKIANDPRITRVGRFLRKYSLDELPQFYQRAEGRYEPGGAAAADGGRGGAVRSGASAPAGRAARDYGLWQVEARQDPSFDSYISLDTAYVENWSLMTGPEDSGAHGGRGVERDGLRLKAGKR